MKVTVIRKPSKELLAFVRKLEDRSKRQHEMLKAIGYKQKQEG